MSFKIVKAAALVMCSTLTFSGASAFAQEAQSLDQLLDFVKKGQVSESKENRSREAKFSKEKANQAAALRDAEAERARQERLSAQLEKTFEDNDLLIADKQKQLQERLGTLTELFGHGINLCFLPLMSLEAMSFRSPKYLHSPVRLGLVFNRYVV